MVGKEGGLDWELIGNVREVKNASLVSRFATELKGLKEVDDESIVPRFAVEWKESK